MRWSSASSRKTSLDEALKECAEAVGRGLGAGPVSLVFTFVTPHFAAHYKRLHELISSYLEPEVFIGCSGGGVIGGSEEVEGSPALSLAAARLPGVEITPFHLGEELPDLDGPPEAWERLIGVSRSEDPQLILLADPFSVRPQSLLAGLDYAYPDSPKVGGLASGASSPGLNALFLNDEVYEEGTVGAALTGDIAVDTVVAQGCKPIGEFMRVTSCDGNMLYKLDGRPALEAVRDVYEGLDERDQRLASTSLFVGVLMDEFKEKPQAGDFLIRNLAGLDPQRSALVVGEHLQEGMGIRFHLRDAEASAGDLHTMLSGYTDALSEAQNVSGALLFSCLGRGVGLYGKPNFDTTVFHEHLGDVPVGGFFCNGEIGPVTGTTFLHGYTSSFALFRPRAE